MRVWILYTRQGRGGVGTADASPVEVCQSETFAKRGAPHHGFAQACYSYEAGPDGTLSDERWEWDTDNEGTPPGEGAWSLKLGPQQVRFLSGCLKFGGWYRDCGWGLHRNMRHDERLAERLVDRGLLVRHARIDRQGQPFTLYRPDDPGLVREIVQHEGAVPESALRDGRVRR